MLRQVTLPSGRGVILSDTVGFISDLPTALIKAFQVPCCPAAPSPASPCALPYCQACTRQGPDPALCPAAPLAG